MTVLFGIHGIGGGGLQKEVPKGPRKGSQSQPGGARAALRPDPEPSWGNPPSTLAHLLLASAPRG